MTVESRQRRATGIDRRAWIQSAGVLAMAFVANASGCHRDAGERRCAFCGMRIARDSHWEAGALGSDGASVSFDTPGCLLRWKLSARGAGLRDPWVTEYYGPGGTRTPARAVRYALGSDVVGPMGPDAVPVDPARLETFVRDHHARTSRTFDEVTPADLSPSP